MGDSLISFCIPTFNRAEELDELLRCIAGQITLDPKINPDWVEVCISDNCSSDDTPKIVEFWSSRLPSLKYFRQNANQGFAPNMLQAVTLASGRYVWLFGDDDLLMAGSIVNALRAITESSEMLPALLYANEGKIKRASGCFVESTEYHEDTLYEAGDLSIFKTRSLESFGHISRLIIRRDIVTEEEYEARETWELMPFLRWVVRAMQVGSVRFLKDVWVIAYYIPSNPHWHGKWLYCQACELPALVGMIFEGRAPSSDIRKRIYSFHKYMRAYFQVSCLRDRNMEAWRYAQEVKLRGIASRIFTILCDLILSSSALRTVVQKILKRRIPSFRN